MADNADYILTNKELKKGFLGLYFGRVTMAIAVGLIGIFLPIFLYNIFDGNIQLVMAYYATSAVLYLFLVAFGTQFLNRFGFQKALTLASFAAACVYTAYFFTTKENMFFLLPLSIFALVIFRLLFWIPYHVDFAIFSSAGKRGGQVGLMLGTITLLGVVGPILAGYLIEISSIQILFLVAILVYILGMIPFSIVPRTYEKFSWTYFQTWKELFVKKNRGMVLASMAAGAEDMIGIVIWPIFIFLLLKGDYFMVGALSSLIVGVTVLLQFLLGNYLDKTKGKDSVLKIGSTLYALGWVIKIFVATAFQVFAAGLYHKITKVVTDTSYDVIFYEIAADQGHYIDEFTVLSEMAIQIGKLLAAATVAILVVFISLEWTFVVGVIASFAFIALSQGRLSRV